MVNIHPGGRSEVRPSRSAERRPQFDRSLPQVLSTVEDAADRSYSHVAVTTKVVIEMQRTSELLDPLLTRSYTEKFGQPTYVLMQNGINIEVDLLNALLALQQQPKIIGTSLWIATKMLGDNVVEHSSFVRILVLEHHCRDREAEPWHSVCRMRSPLVSTARNRMS